MTQSNDKARSLADEALADLAAKLDGGHSQALTEYLAFLARFHRYSWLNALLIMAQRPDATHVAGFNRWRDLKRQVRKGEKGIAILVPLARRRKDEPEDDRETEVVMGFGTGHVFDVAQTDGSDLPSIGVVRGDPGHHLHALETLVAERGIALEYADALGGARGASYGGRIALLCGMEPAEGFSVLAHELAHELLHKGERRRETDARVRELEAEAVAYVVSMAIGLDAGTASADYIHLWNGDAKVLAASLRHVQGASSEILASLL